MPVIVTLSSIPSRFAALAPTLGSILAQTVPPDSVHLYIPATYRRFPDWDGTLPDVPDGVTIHRCDTDFGPATKILPAIRTFRGQDVDLLFCDDDRIYDRNWIARFVATRAAHPDHAIVEAGRFVPNHDGTPAPRAIPRHKGLRYRMLRAITLGRFKPSAWVTSGHVDVLKGYGGVMIRPDFIPDFAFTIPDILWTVDDPWLSGCMASNGVPIWLNAEGVLPTERRIAQTDALLNFTSGGHARGNANEACFEWFRQQHNIWPITA